MPNTTCIPIRRALLSVSNKKNIVELAHTLTELNVEILSTGGTAKLLRKNNIPVIDVVDYTGFPEILGGRVKTLHPKIYGGILARRNHDQLVLQQHDIPLIDLVVVNLYPFAAVTTDPHCEFTDAIENIDVGGPTMLRAAAKNHAYVTVVVDCDDYTTVINEMREHDNNVSTATRLMLAKKAFCHTAQYDAVIANYLTSQDESTDRKTFPDVINFQFHKKEDLRYGENPHQSAAFYRDSIEHRGTIAFSEQIQGKALSFNNIADAEAALECVKEFSDKKACVIVKHANPCGVACHEQLLSAYQLAYRTDPTSSYGGIVAFNDTLDVETATELLKVFVEVVVAPDATIEARNILQTKANVRVLLTGAWHDNGVKNFDFKKIKSGLLIQQCDDLTFSLDSLRTVTTRYPTSQELADLLFAFKVVKHVKSNAIVYALNSTTVGIGAGQMSRVMSSRIAAIKADDAQLSLKNSVMASDAFFPFRDSIDCARDAGITAIIQPGGSIRDLEVIEAANEANIAMVFTQIRHFKH